MAQPSDEKLPKLSDHSSLRFSAEIQRRKVHLVSRNIQNPFGFRLPSNFNLFQPQSYFEPKWDGPELPECVEDAARFIIRLAVGKDSELDSEQVDNMIDVINIIRTKANSLAEKRQKINQLLNCLKNYPLNKSGYYPIESIQLYNLRMTVFFKKMLAEKRTLLMLQEVPSIKQYLDEFNNALEKVFEKTTMVRNKHTSAIISIGDNNNLHLNTAACKHVEQILPTSMRPQTAESDQFIYVVFHSNGLFLCDKESEKYVLSAQKLSEFAEKLKELKKNVNKPIIIAGDFNIPIELADEIRGILRHDNHTFYTKETRPVSSNPFITIDGAIVVVPENLTLVTQMEISLKKQTQDSAPSECSLLLQHLKNLTKEENHSSSARSATFNIRDIKLDKQRSGETTQDRDKAYHFTYRDQQLRFIAGSLAENPRTSPEINTQELFKYSVNLALQAVNRNYTAIDRQHRFNIKLHNMSGDFLKRGLLIEFQLGLMGCRDEQHVRKFHEKFLKSDKYKNVIAESQDITTKLGQFFFGKIVKTSSMCAIDKLVASRMEELSKGVDDQSSVYINGTCI